MKQFSFYFPDMEESGDDIDCSMDDHATPSKKSKTNSDGDLEESGDETDCSLDIQYEKKL